MRNLFLILLRNVRTKINNLIFLYFLKFPKQETKRFVGLFLDDERMPSEVYWAQCSHFYDTRWKIVRTYDEFCKEIQTSKFEAFSFDHDIGERRDQFFSLFGRSATGRDCLYRLVDKLYDKSDTSIPTVIIFHTKNVVGLKNMRDTWNSFIRTTSLVLMSEHRTDWFRIGSRDW